MHRLRLALCLAATLLAGCDMLGIESATQIAAQREAEGKAVGGACRQAGRGIEDCYALNRKADKAAVFAGWREMNDYMRENKMDASAPQLVPSTEVARATRTEPPAPQSADKPPSAKSDSDKPDGKPAAPAKHES